MPMAMQPAIKNRMGNCTFLRSLASIKLKIGAVSYTHLDVYKRQAPDGSVQDFLMNDKCAAGTGRFLQVLSGILGMELAELGEAAGRGKPAAISSMCAVFAERCV